MKHLAVVSSLVLLSGCSTLLQQGERPALSISYEKTDSEYRLAIVSYGTRDLLIEYPFSRMVLVHAVDADGNPTDDVTDIRLSGHSVYYYLESVPPGTQSFNPGQVLFITVPLSESGLDSTQKARDVKYVKISVDSYSLNETKGGWYKRFERIDVKTAETKIVIGGASSLGVSDDR